MTGNAERLNILAISGSLRAASVNSAVLRCAIKLSPAQASMALFGGMAKLPHFNPDLDNDAVVESVQLFRRQLRHADGVVIACPEYAHGVPGAMKNALDWVVASGELVDKPVALINTAPRANLAQASLTETLSVMSARLIDAASITLPIAVKDITETAILTDQQLCQMLMASINALIAAI